MSKLNYQEIIPNNVNLSNDISLQRALEHWQPKFKSWWKEWPSKISKKMKFIFVLQFLVDAAGWASYGKVKMPDYKWGYFWQIL